MSNTDEKNILIYDVKQIKQYADLFLPCIDEDPHNVLYLYLASRRKYCPDMKKDKTCFEKKLLTEFDGDYLCKMIRRYEALVPIHIVPKESLVVYCAINPRSALKGATKLQNKISTYLEDYILNNQNSLSLRKIESIYKSCVHSSVAERRYIELDIDTKDEKVIEKVKQFLTSDYLSYLVCTIETHGGYHVVFKDMDKILKQRMYRHFTSKLYKFQGTNIKGKSITKSYVDVRSDPAQPIPGTIQGGFNVRFCDLFHNKERIL